MNVSLIEQPDIMLFGGIVLLVFLLMVATFFVGAWIRRHHVAVSPYTGTPLREASDLTYSSKKKVLLFLFNKHTYDNRIFEFKRSALCRETGRIFINCISWLGTMHLDWNFLQKRYPGHYLSWGSLNDIQQGVIRDAHDSLDGFQTKYSCPNPSPSAITPEFVYRKPGPLYVDLETKVLLGWQCVPETELEVLIVQKPKRTLY